MPEQNKVDYPIDETLQDVTEDRCPILYALDIVGQKWKLPILWYLQAADATRYNELKRRIPGITNMMLTKSLRELEEAGLVSRDVVDSVPPKVTYALTQNGRDLLPTLNDLYKWGEHQMECAKDKNAANAASEAESENASENIVH